MEGIHKNLQPKASQFPGKMTDNSVEETVSALNQTLAVDKEAGTTKEVTSDEPRVRLVDGVMIVELGQYNLVVDSNEIELLNMHYKYQVNNTLKLEDFELDLAIMGCKYR